MTAEDENDNTTSTVWSFTTKNVMIFNEPTPINGSVGVLTSPTCSISVNHTAGDSMDITFATNASDNWENKQTNTSVASDAISYWDFTGANTYGETYWWRVYADNATVNE